MRIYLEGLDLAGKTTLTRRLQKRIENVVVRNNSLLEHNPLCSLADQHRKASAMMEEPLGWLYYSAMLFDLAAVNETAPHLIQDSTIVLRSIVYHTDKGNSELVRHFESQVSRYPRYDASFVLVSNRERRLERLAGRSSRGNTSPEDLRVRDNPESFAAMERHLVELGQSHFDAVVLDTSNIEDEEASEQILEQILSRGREGAAGNLPRSLPAPGGHALWQRAARLSAHLHQHQMRKDGSTPYIMHPLRVAITLSTIFGVSDPVILAAGLLHDVIEDTPGDFDDVVQACNGEVADLVAALSKDARMPQDRRGKAYLDQLARADWRAKLVKLADVYDNLCDERETGYKGNTWQQACAAIAISEVDPRLQVGVSAVRQLMASACRQTESGPSEREI
jgi:thymidylate kinase